MRPEPWRVGRGGWTGHSWATQTKSGHRPEGGILPAFLIKAEVPEAEDIRDGNTTFANLPVLYGGKKTVSQRAKYTPSPQIRTQVSEAGLGTAPRLPALSSGCLWIRVPVRALHCSPPVLRA